MSAETVLSKLEQDENEQRFTINAPIITLPPLCSSFYWINNSGEKYKVFIPTEKGIVYWNFKEYDRNDMDFNTIDENWRYAKKCVQIAVSNTYEEEQINKVMNEALDFLKKRMIEKFEKELFRESKPEEVKYKEDMKYYIIKKYLVSDILNVDMKYRYKHVRTSAETEISLHDIDHKLIDNAFFEIAGHFRKIESRKVLCYTQKNNHFN